MWVRGSQKHILSSLNVNILLFFIDFTDFYYIINTVTVVAVMGLNNPHSRPKGQISKPEILGLDGHLIY